MTNIADLDAMEASLIAMADSGADIRHSLFDRFFEAFPEQRPLFYNLDAASQRMTNETIEAMYGLASDALWVKTTVTGFVDLHRNYGAFQPEHYDRFVDLTVDCMAEACGSAWNDVAERAWRLQASRLKAMISACFLT